MESSSAFLQTFLAPPEPFPSLASPSSCCWSATALPWPPLPPCSSSSSSSSSSPSSSSSSSSASSSSFSPPAASGARRSASQREKLRMRRLARALRELRRFLPPSVAPPARPLTKLQTLRLAARYIAHLGALLRQEGAGEGGGGGGGGRGPPGGGERQAGAAGTAGAWGSWDSPSEAGSPPETQWPWETPAAEEEALPAAPQSLLPPELLAFLEELEPWPAGTDHYPLA